MMQPDFLGQGVEVACVVLHFGCCECTAALQVDDDSAGICAERTCKVQASVGFSAMSGCDQASISGVGLKTRFIYAAMLGSEDGITFTSLLKHDLEACPGHMVVGQIDLGGPEYIGGEPAFVPINPEAQQGRRMHAAHKASIPQDACKGFLLGNTVLIMAGELKIRPSVWDKRVSLSMPCSPPSFGSDR